MKPKVDEHLIRKLEKLSMLKLKDEERIALMEDIRRILEYMQLLDEVDVEGVEEMVSPVNTPLIPRKEIPKRFEDVEAILRMFPDSSGRFLRLPPIKSDD